MSTPRIAAYVLLPSGAITDFLADRAALITDAFGAGHAGKYAILYADGEAGWEETEQHLPPGKNADALVILIDALKQAGVWAIDTSVTGAFAAAVGERDRARRYGVSLFWIGRWRIAQSIVRAGNRRGWVQVVP